MDKPPPLADGSGLMFPRRAGFTLLEICLVVAIVLLVVLIAVPSIRGLIRGERLHHTFEAIDALARHAQSRSVSERRAYAIVWNQDSVALVPMENTEEQPAEPETLPIGDGESYTVERPAALGKDPPAVWTFWRSGACEPVVISYQGPDGTWTASYGALSSHGTVTDERPL